ncbi:cell surface glycoprotein CD200 receptor 1-like isoform X2 [Antechinus flavipes]|uniref:cell surface glycoprotein CD200 receptor 1-like isoform X2 n=1 Tax=Antechinus flavipes TaxID=38775 RepID=UPI002236813C|nr:cell surface glycoprotein CD200 receptor 1-like isoform X2 [Antechinus flavipes]
MATRSLAKMTSLKLWIIILLLLFGYNAESSAHGLNNSVLIQEQMHLQPMNIGIIAAGFVQVNTNAVFSCYTNSVKNIVMAMWQIPGRDKSSCIVAYRSDTNEIKKTNCFDERIIWEFMPDWNFVLQLDPVSIEDDGYYKCTIVTSDGNFQSGHQLNVLVPPEIALTADGNGSAVCEASAGKPPAQISWIPEGYCYSVNETHGNRTVTMRSICHWNGLNETKVTCFISHLTGNKSLSIELLPHCLKHSALLPFYISLCVLLSLMIIMGFILIWKANCCRIHESQRSSFTPNVNMEEETYENYLTTLHSGHENKN